MAAEDLETYDLVIEPGRYFGRYWLDLWRFRGLLYFFAWRDLLVRYKQTVIGVAWSLIRPFLTMVVFTLIFGRLAGFPTEGGAPYAILVFAALLPWQMTANGFADCSNSLVANGNLLSKVYFPRLLIPLSAAVVSLVDFALSFGMLLLLMGWFGFAPGWRILLLPVFLAEAFLILLGAGIWLAALNVKYRDFRYIVGFMIQIGFYLSPVGFSSTVIPEKWRLLYSLNPMVGVIDGFRWAIIGGEAPIFWPGVLLSFAVATAVFGFGIAYFRRTERAFADFI